MVVVVAVVDRRVDPLVFDRSREALAKHQCHNLR